jgi:hypothetical protein
MRTDVPTGHARADNVRFSALPMIIIAHNVSIVKEMYGDMFAVNCRMQVSSQSSSTTEIPGKWWRAAPEIDPWDQIHGCGDGGI